MAANSSSPVTFVLPALDNTFGAIFIGVIIAAGLWGIGTAQCYWYYTEYHNKDHLALKLLVLFVWILDTVHQALISHVIYNYLVQNFANPLYLFYNEWSLDIQSLFETLICFTVQCFFLLRIWRLSNGKYILVIIPALPILGGFALGLVYVITNFPEKSIPEAFIRFHKYSEGINGATAAGDILLAVLMVYLLYNSRTGIKTTDTLVNKLMIYTVNTGVATSLCAILTLATAQAWGKAFIYGAFYFNASRLYINSMMASLNARQGLRKNSDVVDMSSYLQGSPNQTPQFAAASQFRSTEAFTGAAYKQRGSDIELGRFVAATPANSENKN
ncbi:hypothetical protein C8R44DRAFT_765035 [Mycena epipterygia]|nr:hypothetical protein C8R44DRAFT_765035 [Mycena epipterygia]